MVDSFVAIRTLCDSKWRLQMQGRVEYTNFILLVLGILVTLANSGGYAAPYTSDYYDCSHAKQQSDGNWTGCVSEEIYFPGSPSGFWNVWVNSLDAVLEGIFEW